MVQLDVPRYEYWVFDIVFESEATKRLITSRNEPNVFEYNSNNEKCSLECYFRRYGSLHQVTPRYYPVSFVLTFKRKNWNCLNEVTSGDCSKVGIVTLVRLLFHWILRSRERNTCYIMSNTRETCTNWNIIRKIHIGNVNGGTRAPIRCDVAMLSRINTLQNSVRLP